MSTITAQAVEIEAGPARLQGILGIPAGATSVVAFAHGSGSGRLSPRNQMVATELRRSGIATLLMDLLGPNESDDRAKVFDIDLLADRLLMVTRWLQSYEDTSDLSIGYFGASTGAAAALQAAAQLGDDIGAVVSRGGRPDLAMDYLPMVTAPTLLIVGGNDGPVIDMNKAAYAALSASKELVIVPGATHLFEEPGKLEDVAKLAADWFTHYLVEGQTD
jgi:putative phosphoribosyl transferase